MQRQFPFASDYQPFAEHQASEKEKEKEKDKER
ncbi:MAG: hypothetical protein RIS47_499 [Bacteroidota bacterium]|jgi:hypothetical protein